MTDFVNTETGTLHTVCLLISHVQVTSKIMLVLMYIAGRTRTRQPTV